ncbi:MAG: hypothetical protein ACR2RD_16615 [Woeseiaceae bacterium]
MRKFRLHGALTILALWIFFGCVAFSFLATSAPDPAIFDIENTGQLFWRNIAQIDRFAFATWGVFLAAALFSFILWLFNDQLASPASQLYMLVLFAAAIGFSYLYFSAQMRTGIFGEP